MSINISYSEITIKNNIYSFQDIYDYAVSNNNTQYIQKNNNSYVITNDLIIESGGVEDELVSVTILGDLIQIHKGSFLKIGQVRDDLSTYNGGFLSAPNIKNAYGFGNTTKSNSGNLFLYGSVIDIYGFWGFFNSDSNNPNHVEVIDCQVNGFGRIEGSQSILKNINFFKSHGTYGILSPKGTIKTLENLSTLDSLSDNGNKVSVYHNPLYANNLTIVGGIYDGYDKLAYIESTSGGDTLRFIDSDIRAGYDLERESDNVDLYHDFTFNPTIVDTNNNPLAGARVVINDNSNTEVFNDVSTPQGIIDTTLTYVFGHRSGSLSYKTPHTVTISKDNLSVKYTVNMNRSRKNFSMYLVEGVSDSGTSGGCDCSAIQTKFDGLEARLNTKLSVMESGIRQVIGTVIEEVNENETYFKESGFTIMM